MKEYIYVVAYQYKDSQDGIWKLKQEVCSTLEKAMGLVGYITQPSVSDEYTFIAMTATFEVR